MDKLYKESDIAKRFNYLCGKEHSVDDLFYNINPISRNPEVTPEDITAFLNGEWVDSEKVQAILCMDFSECFKCEQLDFSRTAEWWSMCGKTKEEKERNGVKVTTQFRIQPKDNWIKCSEQMPPEHDSIFAKFKGTDKWKDAMFEKCSDNINVTVVESTTGERFVTSSHTIDGKWVNLNTKYKVIAWQPFPEKYRGEY